MDPGLVLIHPADRPSDQPSVLLVGRSGKGAVHNRVVHEGHVGSHRSEQVGEQAVVALVARAEVLKDFVTAQEANPHRPKRSETRWRYSVRAARLRRCDGAFSTSSVPR